MMTKDNEITKFEKWQRKLVEDKEWWWMTEKCSVKEQKMANDNER